MSQKLNVHEKVKIEETNTLTLVCVVINQTVV